MKNLTTSILAFTILVLSQASFAQDTVKSSVKASKTVTHKVVKHHKVVKKTPPTM